MRWRIRPRDHDHRQSDLVVIVALFVVIVGAWRYFADTETLPPNSTTFIVPSQTVRW